jgi:hypothetical protein
MAQSGSNTITAVPGTAKARDEIISTSTQEKELLNQGNASILLGKYKAVIGLIRLKQEIRTKY